MSTNKPIIIVLLGPTASGKTQLGIEIAENLGLEIHNIDSRQIYIDMDIGTAKPTQEQQKRIKHFLLDLKPPNKKITVHEFQKTAMKSIDICLKRRKIVLLVGGSGLYLKSLTHGLCPPAIPPQAILREQLKELGQYECHQLLQKSDPVSSRKIGPSDSVRTIRALEVFYATGKSISSMQLSNPPAWEFIEIGLNPRNLKERITQRTKTIFRDGILDETENLINQYGEDLSLLQTIGYQEASKRIKGEISLNDAITQTTQRTNQFAKRQKTWFKGQHNPKWLNEENPLSEALSLIHNVIG